MKPGRCKTLKISYRLKDVFEEVKLFFQQKNWGNQKLVVILRVQRLHRYISFEFYSLDNSKL